MGDEYGRVKSRRRGAEGQGVVIEERGRGEKEDGCVQKNPTMRSFAVGALRLVEQERKWWMRGKSSVVDLNHRRDMR